MKKLLILIIAFVSFSASAETIKCVNNHGVEIRFTIDSSRTSGTLVLSANYSFELRLDPYSEKSQYDLYTSEDLSNVQAHYNSVIVFKMPKRFSSSFKVYLEDRDYDDDYETYLYKFKDKGPQSNGYVLRNNLNFKKGKCVFL